MKDIVELERERSAAKVVMDVLAQQNTAKDPSDRITKDIEYQRAISAYTEAEAAYRSAVRLAASLRQDNAI